MLNIAIVYSHVVLIPFSAFPDYVVDYYGVQRGASRRHEQDVTAVAW